MAAKKDSALMELKKQIKNGDIKPLYLFYGEEDYLKETYINQIRDLVPDGGFPEFNHIYLTGSLPFSEYDDAWEAFPMMADRKLIVIKDSGIMKSGRAAKDEESHSTEENKSFWQEKLTHISDDTVVIFSETSVDKRSVIYKAIAKQGTVVEFQHMSDADLVTWVIKQCLDRRRRISKDTAQRLVSRVDPGLNNLNNELKKLFDFCGEEIYASDIDRVVSKSLNVITFDLTNAVMEGDAKKALAVLNDVKANSKESSFAVLYLLLASFEKILHAKLLGSKSLPEIAAELGTAPFIAQRYVNSAKGFSEDALVKMVTRVAEIDLEIKEGRCDEWTALYEYITECLYYQTGRR